MGEFISSLREDLIQLANIFVAQLDRDGKVVFLNKYALELTGYREEEIIDKSWFDVFIPPESQQQARRLFKEALEADYSLPVSEVIILTKNKQEILLSTTMSFLRDENHIPSSAVILGHDLTLALLYEEKVKSEKRWQGIIDNAKEGIYAVDLDSAKIVVFNDAFCGMTGYSRNEVSTMTVRDLRFPEDLEELSGKIKEVLDKDKVVWETKLRRKDGSVVFVEIRASVVEKTPHPICLSVISDITERKHAVEELEASEKKYRTFVDSAVDAIFIADARTGNIVDMNTTAEELIGYRRGELIGHHQTELHPPEDRERYAGIFKEHVRKQDVQEIEELHVLHKDGQRIPVNIKAKVIDINGHRVIQGIFRDITERKLAEKALTESRQLLETIIETEPECVKLIALDGTILQMNRAGLNMLDAGSAAQVVGKSFYPFVVPECQSGVKEYMEKVLAGEPAIFEFEIVGFRGRRLWIETHSALLRNQKNEIAAVVAVSRDITERRQAEEMLKKLNIELNKSNKKLQQLALKDSHTGLYNHRYLTEIVESEFHRAKRYGLFLSVIMLDIDYFKSINDVYGHRFGDMVLKQLAHLFKKFVRRYDVVIRFGGEEFVFILPDTDRGGAINLAQRLLDKIAAYNFGTQEQIVHLKVSLGVATYPNDRVINGMDLVDSADKILVKIKDRGGNQIYASMDTGQKEHSREVDIADSDNVKVLKDKILKLTKRANQSLMEAIYAFARTIKLKDNYTGDHVEKTVHYAVEMARSLALPNDEIENIGEAAMLHDLGKIGISEKILLKKSKLTPKEFAQIKKHPQIGADIIRPIHFLQSIIPLILYHHERYDGTGYLNGLKGEEIPVGARIIAIADVYQSLISNRPYRKAYPKKEAIEIIKQGSGTQFDPHIVDIFLQILKKER